MSVSAAYPNPVICRGGEGCSVHVDLQSACPKEIHWVVMTTAYRKMAGGSALVSGKLTVAWDLKDQRGAPVADGMYYFMIKTDGGAWKRVPLVVLR